MAGASSPTPAASSSSAAASLATPRKETKEGPQTLLLVCEFSNRRVSIFDLDGTLVRTFGDVASPGGALPLRKPFGVLHAHGMHLVSEHEGRIVA